MTYLDQSRSFWQCAADFPGDKESVYLDHAAASEFDAHWGKTVIEYGCGGGSDVRSFLKRGCSVYFFDIVPSNVEVTQARNIEPLLLRGEMFARGTVLVESALPEWTRDLNADVINCHGVLHHIIDPSPVLESFWRALSPKGFAYIMLYTEKLFTQHSQTIVKLLNRSGLDVWQAFGWCTDGQDCPYAKAYDATTAYAMFMEHRFKVISAMETQDGIFRTYKLARVA